MHTFLLELGRHSNALTEQAVRSGQSVMPNRRKRVLGDIIFDGSATEHMQRSRRDLMVVFEDGSAAKLRMTDGVASSQHSAEGIRCPALHGGDIVDPAPLGFSPRIADDEQILTAGFLHILFKPRASSRLAIGPRPRSMPENRKHVH